MKKKSLSSKKPHGFEGEEKSANRKRRIKLREEEKIPRKAFRIE
jgi:hypothetical protein